MAVNQTYTRFVKTLRIALPLLAIVSLVILVVWPILNQETAIQEEPITITAEEKPEGVSDDALQMINPEFTGVDSKNNPYTITAETVFQGSTEKADITLINPVADLELQNNGWVSLKAEKGVYQPSQEKLTLDGDVTLFQHEGYQLTTAHVDVDLKKGSAHSNTHVSGFGPLGSIEAKGMDIGNNGSLITFAGSAKLILYTQEIK